MKAWTDGAASPTNPGPCGCGWVLDTGGGEVVEGYQFLGHGTNNFAEYRGLINLLELLGEMAVASHVTVHLDSQLVVRQFNGEWQCKSPTLEPLLESARAAAKGLDVAVVWIPREQNARADSLSKLAVLTRDTVKGRVKAPKPASPPPPDEWVLVVGWGEPAVAPMLVRRDAYEAKGIEGLQRHERIDADEIEDEAPVTVCYSRSHDSWG